MGGGPWRPGAEAGGGEAEGGDMQFYAGGDMQAARYAGGDMQFYSKYEDKECTPSNPVACWLFWGTTVRVRAVYLTLLTQV